MDKLNILCSCQISISQTTSNIFIQALLKLLQFFVPIVTTELLNLVHSCNSHKNHSDITLNL